MNVTIKLRRLTKLRVHRIVGLALLTLELQCLQRCLPYPTHTQMPSGASYPPNAEAQLAAGHRLKLSGSRLVDLELIPGISDGLANNLLVSRDRVLRQARISQKLSDCSTFELVHGIGPKTAEKLCRWLEPR